MAFASAVRMAIQAVMLPLIAMFISPTEYGQVALVAPFIFFSIMLAESGLGACIVRAVDVTAELEGTVFCFTMGVSAAIIVLLAFIAGPLGSFFGEPSFPALLVGMSTILIFAALNVVPAARLLRNKEYASIAISDFVSAAGGIGGVWLGIYSGWGAWSLVAQQIGFWALKVMAVWYYSHYRPRIKFSADIIRENFKFGANLTITSTMTFILRNVDNVIVGKFFGTSVLGLYALAFQIVGLPSAVLSGSLYYTVFVETSEATREGRSSTNILLRTLRGCLLVTSPIMVGMAVTAHVFVPLILGEKWSEAADYLACLAPLGWCLSMGALISGAIIGVGRSDLLVRIEVVTIILTLFGIMSGAQMSGLGVAVGVSLAAIASCGVTLAVIARLHHIPFHEVLRVMYAPLLGSIFMGLVVVASSAVLPSVWPGYIRLMIMIITGLTVYPAVLFAFFKKQLASDLESVKTAFLKRPITVD